MAKQVNIDTPIQFLSDFKEYHDQRVKFCRMYSNIWIREFDKQVSIAETFLKKAVESCDFCMCMRPESFEQALKDNEIKEMFEIGHGATVGGIKTRRKALKQLYDLDSEQYPIKEMPKYGLLVGKQKYHDLIQDPDVFYHYGIIMLTFKKERLLHRTTMTVGSSLQFDESLLKTPTFVTDPKFICIKGVPKDPMSSDGFFLGVSYFANHLITLNKLSPDMPNRMADFADGISGFENFELQYFGKITISDDVKEVCYMPLGGEEEEQIERLKPLLAQYGLECKRFGEETLLPTIENNSTKSPQRKKQVESQEKQAESQEKQAESQEKQTKPRKKQTESQEKQAESQEKQTKTKEKQVEPKEKQTKPRKKQTEPKEKQAESQEKQTKTKEKQVEPKEKQTKPRKKQTEPKEKQAELQEKQTKTKEKQVEPKEKQAESRKKQVEPKEKQTKSRKKQAEPKEKQAESKEKQVESKEKQAEPKEKQTKPRKTNKKLDK